MRPVFRLAAAAMSALALPSCNFSMSVENMLSPPRLTVEQEQIYQALITAAGSSVSLRYPKSGTRLSAFTVEDLDGDGSDEAIVFYEAGRAAAEENPLRICLLDQQDGAWKSVSDYPAEGAEIDRVDVERLGTNARTNLIVSYSAVDGADHAAGVYHYENGALERSLSVPYTVMALRDLNQDGTPELFTASSGKAPSPATATVYELNESGRYVPSQLNLPESFTDVSRLLFGSLPAEDGSIGSAIYMDGSTGATTVQTAVLLYSGGALSLLYADRHDYLPNTERPAGCATMDIDDDGEMEIPIGTSFYGWTNPEVGSPLLMTSWYVCRSGRLMREYASYYSVQENYVFIMPEKWERRVTAVQENDEIVFYAFDTATNQNDGLPVLTEQLLRLAVVTDPIAADAMQSEGYMLLRRQGNQYYLGKRLSAGSRLALTESELFFAMKVL